MSKNSKTTSKKSSYISREEYKARYEAFRKNSFELETHVKELKESYDKLSTTCNKAISDNSKLKERNRRLSQDYDVVLKERGELIDRIRGIKYKIEWFDALSIFGKLRVLIKETLSQRLL